MNNITLKKYITIMLFWYVPFCTAQTSVISVANANACIIQTIQTTDYVVVAGDAMINNIDQSVIVRYQANGVIDTTFGSNGMTATSIGIQSQSLAMALQPDGKIVTVGFAISNNVNQVALMRYTVNGALDTSFNLTGIVTTPVANAAIATAVKIDSNNKIVIAGVTIQSGAPQFLVIRYNPDGSLDNTFGTNGIVITPIGLRSKALGLAIQSNGQIVVCGYSSDGLSEELFTLVRYNAIDGSLDSTFGANGIVTTVIGNRSHATTITIAANGTIYVAGFSDTNYALARYTGTGILDTTFANNGVVVVALGSKTQINNSIIDINNNIVLTGFSDNNLLIARYTASGVLDTAFNATGQALLSFETTNVGNGVALQTNGQIIVAGSGNNDFLIARYNANGTIDVSWGTDGIVSQPGNSNYFTNIWEAESTGTNGGTFTAGTWQTRVLNTVTSISNMVTLNNNQFTLNPGIYAIYVSAPAYQVDNHQVRLQNVTDGITTLVGTSAFSSSNGGTTSHSTITGQFIISKQTIFEIQHICATTQANDGLGIATGFGTDEIYTNLKITNNFSF